MHTFAIKLTLWRAKGVSEMFANIRPLCSDAYRKEADITNWRCAASIMKLEK